jgi:hypothetical protein
MNMRSMTETAVIGTLYLRVVANQLNMSSHAFAKLQHPITKVLANVEHELMIQLADYIIGGISSVESTKTSFKPIRMKLADVRLT